MKAQDVADYFLTLIDDEAGDSLSNLKLQKLVCGARLSKKALFRELGAPNPDPAVAAVEREVLERANRLGIGPQGYGGDTTAFGIHILTYPCHITSLPVAVTIECHAHRHKEVTL